VALGFIREVDADGYFNAGNFAVPSTDGIYIDSGDGQATRRTTIYYDRLDYIAGRIQDPPGSGSSFFWARFDPLLIDNTSTLFDQDVATPNGPDGVTSALAVGEWDVVGGVQKLYALTGTSSVGRVVEITPTSFGNVETANPFNNAGINGTGSGLPSSTIGHYSSGLGSGVLFETAGYLLSVNCTVRHTDDVPYSNVMAQVDLTTGLATIVETPVFYTVTGNQFAAPSLFGTPTVSFNSIQFVPDEASTPGVPVGQLFLVAFPEVNPQIGGLNVRTFYKFVEWNPDGVESTPSRVHLRERLLSASEFVLGGKSSPTGQHTVCWSCCICAQNLQVLFHVLFLVHQA